MDFNEIVKKVEETKDLTLDGLFDLWKEAQAVEEEWEKTTLVKDTWTKRDKLRKYFTADGIIDPNVYTNASPKVLVVLKEPNVSDNKEDTFFDDIGDHRVWYNEFVNGKYSPDEKRILFMNQENNLEKADNDLHQKELIGRMSFLLQNLTNTKKLDGMDPTAEQVQNALKGTAVMNLNKRGGGKSEDQDIFPIYCDKYNAFIRREIEVINPNVIIWCAGTVDYKEYVSQKVSIIPMYHTAYFQLSNTNKYLLKACDDCDLELVLKDIANRVEDGDLAFNRNVAKYMLVFKEKVREALGEGSLSL